MALGAKLRVAREAAGLSQEAVAEQVGVSRPTLSAIEAGKTRIDSLLLERLARLYRRDLLHFFGQAKPVEEIEPALWGRLGELSPRDCEAVAAFLSFCDNLARLRELLSRRRVEPPPSKPLASGVRKYAAEVEAREERARLGIGDALVGERLFELLDLLGLPTYRAPLGSTRVSGFLIHHPKAGPAIFVNAAQYRWRQVFTAAHEYGHYLFSRGEQPVACRIFAADEAGSEVSAEEFMNAFASEFLMPEDGVKRLLVATGAASARLGPAEVVRLQRHFGVSFQAMLYRLLRLRLIGEEDLRQMQAEVQPVALAWRMGYPVESEALGETGEDELDLARKFPASYVEMTLEAFERGLITNGKAAELLELNRGAFDRFYRVRRRTAEAVPREEGLEHVVA